MKTPNNIVNRRSKSYGVTAYAIALSILTKFQNLFCWPAQPFLKEMSGLLFQSGLRSYSEVRPQEALNFAGQASRLFYQYRPLYLSNWLRQA